MPSWPAQSVERRWQRFMNNAWIRVERFYVPLVLAVWVDGKRNAPGNGHDGVRGSLLHDSLTVVCCGRRSAVVVASARTRQCNGSPAIQGAVTKSQILRHHPMPALLADRGKCLLMSWCGMGCGSCWHYCLRLPLRRAAVRSRAPSDGGTSTAWEARLTLQCRACGRMGRIALI